MPYIDREKLLEQIDSRVPVYYDEEMQVKDLCIQLMENAPVENVVPRSEVEALKKENEILSASNKTLAFSKGRIEAELNKAKQEVANKIFEQFGSHISTGIRILKDCINDTDTDQVKRHLLGRLHELCGMEKFIAELRKKYIVECELKETPVKDVPSGYDFDVGM